jgi:hypothetical protein
MTPTSRGYTCAACGQYLDIASVGTILRHERSVKHLKAAPPQDDDDDDDLVDGIEGVV